jgi:hypothetical protein
MGKEITTFERIQDCEWSQDSEWTDNSVWNTSCSSHFVLNEGSPDDNGMNYCPYCGGKLIPQPTDNKGE